MIDEIDKNNSNNNSFEALHFEDQLEEQTYLKIEIVNFVKP
jgi:hypothetical protein